MSQKSHIFIVTQDESDHDTLAKILQGYQLTFYKEIQTAQEQILHQLPELIIIDSNFGTSGFNLCRNILHNHTTATIPVLFIFNHIERNGISTMFNSGGSDYISKPFNQYEIISRVYIHTTYAKQKKELDFLANYDPMTQTYNRRSFFKKAQHAIKFAQDKKIQLSLIVFHIATLFKINDDYGHFTGDKIILEFASILKKELLEQSIIGRLNGNDFTILITNKSKYDVETIVTNIVKKAHEIVIDTEKPVKIEYGLAQLRKKEETIDELFLEASLHLEECKIARSTRNY